MSLLPLPLPLLPILHSSPLCTSYLLTRLQNMSAWGTEDMAASLPTPEGAAIASKSSALTPQQFGWAAKVGYDYATYSKTTKELSEEAQGAPEPVEDEEHAGAVGGILPGQWANNAAVYMWDDDFGDVGPRFPQLEQQLFGSEFHVKSGIQFEK